MYAMSNANMTCRYVHYEVDTVIVGAENKNPKDNENSSSNKSVDLNVVVPETETKSVLFPPQWLHCDLRYFDMTVLGKFSVIMADPPWDIHMEVSN